ncbi:MAG: transcriptional repressor [Clostridia bacterium]|nr:transcriptional repressor [Clostridia bacterium]
MAVQRYSKQRELILNDLKNRCDHPTAEMVYESVVKKCPAISLGTVYRNLNTLAENGQILKLSVGGADHFDGCTDCHYHLVCKKCKRVFDKWIERLPKEIADINDNGFEVGEINVTLYGVCKDCKGL